ncbi:MAG: SDR family NAD(P)-dependent oxidoreductase [Acidimicrobiales bacterium]
MSYLTERAGLEGKVAVVTGGAGGLGWPIARDLARAGVRVAVCDRDPAAVADAAASLAETQVETIVRHADVRESEAMETFFAEVDDAFGRLDVLIDVPGGGFVTPLMSTNAKGWHAIIRQNFTYVLDTTQRAVQRMRAQGTGGSIIYITSVEAHRAVPYRAVYGAMKAGVTSLAKTLALELSADNIRVNTVAPDIFPTPATGGVDPEFEASPQGRLRRTVSIPSSRYGSGEDLSGCLLFLASDLSTYVNGTTIHVDGGTLASSGWFNWPEEGWANMPPPSVLDALAAAEDPTAG